jgi:uncharacterized protein with HEPN domain
LKDDRLHLLHMDECLGRIEEYVADGREAFILDHKTQDAVLRNLQTMAESSQLLSDALKASLPEIDWRGISGLRNILVHDYLGVSLPRIWELVEKELPALRHAIRRSLET